MSLGVMEVTSGEDGALAVEHHTFHQVEGYDGKTSGVPRKVDLLAIRIMAGLLPEGSIVEHEIEPRPDFVHLVLRTEIHISPGKARKLAEQTSEQMGDGWQFTFTDDLGVIIDDRFCERMHLCRIISLQKN
jgi:hypothetical protein